MDKKIADLRKCITRVAGIRPYMLRPGRNMARERFVALWKARNRRTRVLMFRARAYVDAVRS